MSDGVGSKRKTTGGQRVKVIAAAVMVLLLLALGFGYLALLRPLTNCEEGEIESCVSAGETLTSLGISVGSEKKCREGDPHHCLLFAIEANMKRDYSRSNEFFYEACVEGFSEACLVGSEYGFSQKTRGGLLSATETLEKGCRKFNFQKACDSWREVRTRFEAQSDSERKLCEAGDINTCIYLGRMHLLLAQPEDALKELSKSCDMIGGRSCALASSAAIQAENFALGVKLGMKTCNDSSKDGCYNAACAYCRLGKVSEAMSALRLSIEAREVKTEFMEKDPDLECLRKDPRYLELLTR